ncbi:MAG: glucokinase [Stenotrophomonas sp.]|jgi:glucokinase|nr:MAG: glucokinase [Stenotrophomonas sp.]
MSRPALDDAARSEAIQDSESGSAIIGADVGGTYARLGWTRLDANGALSVRGFRKYTCAEHPSLAAILLDYANWLARETSAPQIAHAVVAIAGVLDGDTLLNTNLAWPVSLGATRRDSGLETLELINDFVAVAQAMAHADADALHLICGDPTQVVPGPAVVLGPGTGLGVAVYLPGGNPSVLASEAGHAALAGSTPLEQDVLRLLSRQYTHIDNERILSGPGLLTLYTSLCELRGSTPQWRSPADLVAAAGTDPLAAESIEVFCAWLGSLAGDLALTFGARAVYLTGGITGHLSGPLHAGGFQQRFLAKDRLSQALRHVPVWRVEHGELGVLGALAWHVDKLAAR